MNRQIELLKRQDRKTITEIYNEYRTGFLLYAKRYKLEEDRILDIYQDSIIALCENAQKGKIDNLSASLKTYLFAIGKYMIFSELRKDTKKTDFEELENILITTEDSSETNDEEVEQLKLAFNHLGEKCKEILKLFYYQERNLDEITELMSYDNKNVAKSQKSRCLRQLKQIIENNYG